MKLAKIKLNCHLDIATHPDITEYSNITKHILERVELEKSDEDERIREEKYKEVLGSYSLLIIRSGLVIGARL